MEGFTGTFLAAFTRHGDAIPEKRRHSCDDSSHLLILSQDSSLFWRRSFIS
jgi:hypothetical protein